LSAIPRREVGRRFPGPSCPAPVSCAGCEPLSTASPRGRLSRPPSTTSGSDSREALGAPRGATYLGLPRHLSDLPSSRRFSPHIPRSSWTPADPRGPHPSGPSVWASGTLTPSPSAFRSYGAVSSFRECGLPCGLCGSLCTLQLVRSGSHPSSPTATLGTGGWLGLTRQGLSPCKKRQASLGALTLGISGGAQRRPLHAVRQAKPTRGATPCPFHSRSARNTCPRAS